MLGCFRTMFLVIHLSYCIIIEKGFSNPGSQPKLDFGEDRVISLAPNTIMLAVFFFVYRSETVVHEKVRLKRDETCY